MKYFKQFCVIMTISFLGELLNRVLPFLIPGSVYGIILLFAGLQFQIIPMEAVRETGEFLIAALPLIFIAPSVGMIETWGIFQEVWIPCTLTAIVSTIVVMAVSGCIVQKIMKKRRRDKCE